MAKIQPVKAGDPITEGLLNRIVDQLERFSNLKSGSPYIRLWDSPNGKAIALALPQQTWALLSGSSSPYSFTEVRDGPGGTWVSMPNGDSGTTNAYEINGKSGLADKVVPITWTSAGDWRFQWVGFGCSADSDHVCICDCPTPFPKQFFYGDANGTHTLNWLGPLLGWRGTATQAGVDVYDANTCTHSTTALDYSFNLSYSCVPGAGSPSTGTYPTGYWTFGVGFRANFNCTGSYKYTNNLLGAVTLLVASQLIEGFHCDFSSGFSFTIPTVVNGLAVPGGGGLITVLP